MVLPEPSGPKTSTMRPRGMPPTPSAMSSAIDPVGMTDDAGAHRVLAELHHGALAELLLDLLERDVEHLVAVHPRGLLPTPAHPGGGPGELLVRVRAARYRAGLT